MKRIVMFLLSSLACMWALADGSITLGYCNGEVGEGSYEYSGTGTSSAAVRLSKESLKAYEGNDIVSIRVGLAARINIDKLQVWVKSELDGEPIASAEIGKGDIKKGWNSLDLEMPFHISAERDLYVGYSFHQKANVKAISLVGKPLVDISYVKRAGSRECRGNRGRR